jgi:hypothetical protein
VTESVLPEDLQPYSASPYAWRWQDPRHTFLPSEVLDAIRVVRAERARELFPRSLELDWWAREAPDRVFDLEAANTAETAAWLLQLAPPDTLVILSWHREDALLVPWGVLAEYWDAFWYPASDDVTVFPLSEAWVLSCDHEGRFSWRRHAEVV